MKEIQLTQGKVALVDDDDFENLIKSKWQLDKSRCSFYAIRHKAGKTIRMHSEIMGNIDGMVIDHIDGNGLNNQKSNLRFCTNSENLHNRGKTLQNTSGYKGIFWDKRRSKWYGQVCIMFKKHTTGYFSSKDEAVKELENIKANLGIMS